MNKPNKDSGIYQIINLKNGKCYIGQGKNILNRCATHKTKLKSNTHPNQHLQNAWNKYGESAFEFRKIINLPLNKEMLTSAEQYWSNFFKESSGVYNKRDIVDSSLGLKTGPRKNPRTPEHCQKISEANKGKKKRFSRRKSLPKSEETKRKIGAGNKGKIRSSETLKKLSDSHKGYKYTSERIETLRQTQLKRWKKLKELYDPRG